MADVNVRRSQHVASKAAEEEEEQTKRAVAALEYGACLLQPLHVVSHDAL
jgi:hypothetical protein